MMGTYDLVAKSAYCTTVPRLRLNHLLESLFLVANDSYYPYFCDPTGNRRAQARGPAPAGRPSRGRGILRATASKISVTDSPWGHIVKLLPHSHLRKFLNVMQSQPLREPISSEAESWPPRSRGGSDPDRTPR
jgi:hypothetical protein